MGDVKLGKVIKYIGLGEQFVSVITLFNQCLGDFGISAQITASIAKRKSFIGTPYWYDNLFLILATFSSSEFRTLSTNPKSLVKSLQNLKK